MRKFDHGKFIRLLYQSCMSQKEVAKKAGISVPTMSTMLNKRTEPSLLTIAKLARGFGVDGSGQSRRRPILC